MGRTSEGSGADQGSSDWSADAEGKPARSLSLAGKAWADAVSCLRAELDSLGADGAPFASPGDDVLRKLATHFADASRVLGFVSENTADCTEPRCSPATFSVESRTSPAEGIEIAIGFRPGDAERSEPFLYVALAPRPRLPADEIDDLAELEGGGEWTDEDWFGAVLPGSAVLCQGSSIDKHRAAPARRTVGCVRRRAWRAHEEAALDE